MSNDRFDKFTERARKVLTLAQEEATRLNHNYIGTEHLLLGLVREGEGVAAKVLSNLGVDLDGVRDQIEFIIGRGDRMIVGEIGLTPRAKKVIELAVDEARRLGHHYIGTEHLLLGLVREGEGTAAGALESLGVNLEKVRTQTIQVLSQNVTSIGEAVQGSSGAAGPEPQMGRYRGAAEARTQWEYLVAQVAYTADAEDGTITKVSGSDKAPPIPDKAPLHEALQILGADGWELVTIETLKHKQRQGATSPFYVFKRPI
jgi:ATP-dependent Clp protease ATP-binding subunit ClpA